MGPKFLYFRISGLELWKTIFIFEISTLQFVRIEFLTQIVNFYVGPTFSKVSGSAFSEGLCQSLGPIYKVCQINQRELQETMNFKDWKLNSTEVNNVILEINRMKGTDTKLFGL